MGSEVEYEDPCFPSCLDSKEKKDKVEVSKIVFSKVAKNVRWACV